MGCRGLEKTTMAIVVTENFEHILRIMGTNVDGRQRVMYALTAIPGVGRRYSNLVNKEEIDRVVSIIEDPLKFNVPVWFLNRQKDYVTGKDLQATGTRLAGTLREDLERLKKMRAHRGLRHYWGLRVRGQHTKTT